ncbi:class I SAM-dependent methyltransferase [Aromatoleum toluolicum]|nr:class I SAM-dependent methyltransferase [Aromatoleum toluolicum]NMF96724.2 class I SAM-dependent methyltransferase [Aromatoleum toluolicum]
MNKVAEGPVSSWLRRQRAEYWLTTDLHIVGKIAAMQHVQPRHFGWLRRGGVRDFSAAILDVGCGLGDRLLTLRREGFTNLVGIDPFIGNDIHYQNGVRVLKLSVHEMDGAFDFITLHHSFEHMPDPLPTLQSLFRLVKPGHAVLIRIPVCGTNAWRTYGHNWVQLDAPRHLFLHSIMSMQVLAKQAGFRLGDIVFDSEPLQFWGSEQYVRDIPLLDPRSYEVNPESSIFTREQIQQYRQRAAQLNLAGDGDQACFYLVRDH